MKLLATFAGVSLAALTNVANAALVHYTCKQGTSPTLKLMCYAGFNSSSDLLAYDYVDTKCEAVSESVGTMYSSILRQSTVPYTVSWQYPHLQIQVGCPEGYYIWFALTRVKPKNNPEDQWQDWQTPPDGDDEFFSCTH